MRSVRPRRTTHPVLGWPTTNATHRRLGVAQTPDTTNQRRGREEVSLVCLSGCLFVYGLWPGWGADPQGYTRQFCEFVLYGIVRGFEDDTRHRQPSTVINSRTASLTKSLPKGSQPRRSLVPLLASRCCPHHPRSVTGLKSFMASCGRTVETCRRPPLKPLPRAFTSEDYRQRIQRVVDSAATVGLAGVVVTPGPDLVWLTGYRPTAITERLTMLVLRADEQPTLLVPVLERPDVESTEGVEAVALLTGPMAQTPTRRPPGSQARLGRTASRIPPGPCTCSTPKASCQARNTGP